MITFDLGIALNFSDLSLAIGLNHIYLNYVMTIITPLLAIFSNCGLLNAYFFSSSLYYNFFAYFLILAFEL